jgi:hypothetical protein
VAGPACIAKKFPLRNWKPVLKTAKLIHIGGINRVNRASIEMIGTENSSQLSFRNSTVIYPRQQTFMIREKICLFTIAQYQNYL